MLHVPGADVDANAHSLPATITTSVWCGSSGVPFVRSILPAGATPITGPISGIQDRRDDRLDPPCPAHARYLTLHAMPYETLFVPARRRILIVNVDPGWQPNSAIS